MRKSWILIAAAVALGGCVTELDFTSEGGNECVWKDADGGLHDTGDPACDRDAGPADATQRDAH